MNLNRIILLLLLLGASYSVYAKTADADNSLSGKITDMTTNQPLVGATLYFPDLKAGAVTDQDGHYKISNLPSGNFLLQITYVGYKTFTTTINISGELQKDFALSTSAVEQDEIVVTGQSKATQIRFSAVPIVAVGHQYLNQHLSTNIISAIAKVPGVSAISTGPNVAKPIIRGLGFNRVLTLYDGMRQEGQQWGDEHGIEVDEYNVDHVEIVKGPSSLSYGSDALAGVVNLIPTQPAPEGKTIGNIMAEYQGNDGLIGTSAMFSGNHNGIYWLGRLSYKMAKDYQNKVDGSVYGTNFQEKDAYAAAGINRGWGYSHLSLSVYDDLQAIPDGSRDSASRRFTKQITEADNFRPIVSNNELNNYTLPDLHQHVQHYRVYSSNSFNLGESRLALNIALERDVRREFSHPEAPDVPGLYLKLNSYMYDFKYYFPEFSDWQFTTGVNGMYQTNNVTGGTEFIIPNYNEFDFGPFVMAKKTFGNLNITGGIRFDSRTFNNDGLYTVTDPNTGFDKVLTTGNTAGADHPFSEYSHTFTGFTGSAGFTYKLSDNFSVKANFSRGYRAPNISEISANGVHPGTNIYQIGNLNFKPEFSMQEDIGADYISKHVSASISLFNNNIQNYIYNQKVLNSQGQDSIIVEGNETFKFAASNAQLYGGEFSLDIHPHPLDWLHFENTLSAVYGINKGADGYSSKGAQDSAKYLPFIPPLHGTSELRANIKQVSPHFRNAFVKFEMDYYAAQNRAFLAYNTETPTPGYILFNFGAGTDITNHAGKALFNVSVFVNNLFNKAYQDHLNRLKYFEDYPNDPRPYHGIYNMGRNIGVRVSVPLAF